MVYGRRKFITAHYDRAIAIRMKMPSRIFVYRLPDSPQPPPSLTACEPFTKMLFADSKPSPRPAMQSEHSPPDAAGGRRFLIRNGNVSCPLRLSSTCPGGSHDQTHRTKRPERSRHLRPLRATMAQALCQGLAATPKTRISPETWR